MKLPRSTRARPSPVDPPTAVAAPPTAAAIVDTGLLVAQFDRLDAHHAAAQRWISDHDATLLTMAPALSEAAFFLPARLRAHPATLREARKPGPDWADMEMVWLAETTGVHRIPTVDLADFSLHRIHGRQRFELELLR